MFSCPRRGCLLYVILDIGNTISGTSVSMHGACHVVSLVHGVGA